MGRARRARRIASKAAYGGGVTAASAVASAAAAYGLLRAEARIARRVVGTPFDTAPEDSGTYGHGFGDAVHLLVLGDSSARGMGADERSQTVGSIIATAVAALTGRPVQLTNVAVVGAQSADLDGQVDQALAAVPQPDVVVIMVGANDVTHRISRSTSVRHLAMAVRRLRESGAEVVVGTCPDLGTIRPLPQPLRLVARRYSRDLAAAQTVAVVEQGGRTVSLGDLIGPDFAERPAVMFSQDRFHPSPAGYARAASALLPSVLDALGQPTPDTGLAPDRRRGESVGPVAEAAVRAVRDPGTEVSATELHGSQVGHRGRWAVLRRRRRQPVPAEPAQPDPDSAPGVDDGDLDNRRASARADRA
ncbi:SGNH/GDSL hydrolase family protein [Luteipulveratus sp. YIM 133296]|uniref:SGNH/GDSL hydrolase family protein n=1 Tax=Luteipulveratus flavus TaxID=3031728 RepID=A0ABT6CC07_9MICO|nr:SGNH/GDSL hydrolase family protein [Luteipulveratus sp. YIM 133296]MDF8266435.1 SGNH/GDSL hydrolase family protein [Luteipulveratus sp. YIM 133296]